MSYTHPFAFRARELKRIYGTRTAADYLKRKGVVLREALHILTGRVIAA